MRFVAYSTDVDEAKFDLSGTDVQGAAALNGQTLTVRDEEGAAMEVFAGYAIASIKVDGEIVHVRFTRAMDEQTAEAIAGLEGGIKEVAERVSELSAATSPQLVSLAGIVAPAMAPSMTDEQALAVSDFFPEYAVGADYKQGDVLRFDGRLFRVAQDHTSQEQWVLGEAGTESLYTEIEVAGDGVDVWQQPTGAHDAYNVGDRVHYPDEDGPVYVSTIDGNTWAPDAYPQGWQLEA